VAHHVPLVEVEETDPFDAGEHGLGLAQARHPPLRQVDLGDVAVDHRLRAEADAGEEHLHLLGGRVLGLVEDDEAVVQASGRA
jgi:hypothetical protein